MASFEELKLLLQVEGDSKDAQKDLATLSGALGAFGAQEASAEAEVHTAKALASLGTLQTALDAFSKKESIAKLKTIQDRGNKKNFADLLSQLNSFNRREYTSSSDVEVTRSIASVTALNTALRALTAKKHKAQVEVDVDREGPIGGVLDQTIHLDINQANYQTVLTRINQLTSSDLRAKIGVYLTREEEVRRSLLELRRFGEQRIRPAVVLDDSNALGKLNKLSEALTGIDEKARKPRREFIRTTGIVNQFRTALLGAQAVKLDPEVKTNRATKKVNNLRFAFRALAAEKVEVPIGVDQSNLQQELIRAERALQNFDNKASQFSRLDAQSARLTAEIIRAKVALDNLNKSEGVDQSKLVAAQARVKALESDLVRVTKKKTTLRVEVDTDESQLHAKVAQIKASLASIPRRKEVKLDVDGRALGVIRLFSSALERAGVSTSRFNQKMNSVRVSLGIFSTKMSAAIAALLAFVASVLVAAGGAIALLITALGGAAVAVGGLATALVGTLIPALGLGIAAASRMGKVMEALKAEEQEEAGAARKSAEATQAAAQQTERRREAALAVTEALRSVAQAERSVQQAATQAGEEIARANQSQARAAESLQSANADLKRSAVDAYQAIADAAEKVSDALLSIEDAKLGLDEASLGIKEAEASLASLREESGASGDALNDIFKKFTDVDVDFDPAAVLRGLSSGGVEGPNATELQRAILNVRRAKLAEKQATDRLSDSERDLGQSRAEQFKFQKQGINAFEPYTSALKTQQDAVRSLNEASSEANALNAQGVSNAPGVVSALESLGAAERRLAEARRERLNVQSGAGLLPTDESNAQKLLAELTAAERAFLTVLKSVKAQMRTMFQPATDAIISGLTYVVARIPQMFAPLMKNFLLLGQSIAGAMRTVMDTLLQPQVVAQMNTLVGASAQLATILGGRAFSSFLQIMLNIATAALPSLLRGAEAFAVALAKWERGPLSMENLQKVFAATIPMLSLLGSLTGAFGGLLVTLFQTLAPFAAQFLVMLTKMVDEMNRWLQSQEGQEMVKRFFSDLMPLIGALLPFFGQLVTLFLQIVQMFMPALVVILKLFTGFLGIVNEVVGALMPLLQVIIKIAAIIFTGLYFGFAKVITILTTLASFFPGVFSELQKVIASAVDFITDAFGGLLDILKWPFEQFFKFIDSIGSWIIDLGVKFIDWFIAGVKKAPGKLYNTFKDLLGPIGDLLPGSEPKDPSSPLHGLGSSGESIFTNLIEGFPQGSKRLASALESKLVPVVDTMHATVQAPKGLQGAGAGGSGMNIESQTVNVPSAPGYEGMGDPTSQALKFARELRRRGRGRGF